QNGQQVLYVRQPDADALLAHLGGAADTTRVSVNGAAPVATAGGTSTTTAPPTTTVPSAPTQGGTPGAAPTARIEDQSVFGAPAPKTRPC
ncbi:MAG TPA: hypothetical protein VGU73_07535, partial [Acidimicrobiia bacterium]|nr:hypothetical protein [Acidimicrobiia bacterium]